MGKRLVRYAAKAIAAVRNAHPALMGKLLPGQRDDQKAGRPGLPSMLSNPGGGNHSGKRERALLNRHTRL